MGLPGVATLGAWCAGGWLMYELTSSAVQLGGVTAMMLLDQLNPRFAEAEVIPKDDKRLATSTVEIDSPQVADHYMLCSDGLSKMVDDDKIKETILADKNLDAVVGKLIEKANDAGGRDNISVILVRVDEVQKSPSDKPSSKAKAPAAKRTPPPRAGRSWHRTTSRSSTTSCCRSSSTSARSG